MKDDALLCACLAPAIVVAPFVFLGGLVYHGPFVSDALFEAWKVAMIAGLPLAVIGGVVFAVVSRRRTSSDDPESAHDPSG